jgi:hypothetical protein
MTDPLGPRLAWLGWRWVRVTSAVVIAVTMVVGTAGLTARATLLKPAFVTQVVDQTQTVNRIYDEILVDPELLRLSDDLSAGQRQAIRTAKAAIGVNIRLVLPPDTVRQLLVEQIDAFVGWLNGDRRDLELQVSLDPIIANLQGLTEAYLSEVLAATPTLSTETLPALRDQLNQVVSDLRAGRRPSGLPSLAALRADPDATEAALLAYVPDRLHDSVRPLLDTALRSGDTADTLAIVLSQVLAQRAVQAGVDLVRLSGGRRVSFTALGAAAIPAGTVHTVKTVRWWLGTPLLVILVLCAVLGLLALLVLLVGGRATTKSRVAWIGAGVGAGALLSVGLAVAVWSWLGSMVDDVRQASWPPSVRALVADLGAEARSGVLRAGLRYTAVLVIAAATLVLLGLALSWVRLGTGRVTWQRPQSPVRVVALGATVVGLVALLVALIPTASPGAARCNGAVYLCSRPYDQVVTLATHNAMANTQDSFLFPLQDPDIDTQLDAGARGLQLDSWTWETPEQATQRLAESDFPPDAKAAVRRLLETANPPRPGTWLCHNVCRLGALPIVAALDDVRLWLDRNPREVVTIILQDETPAALTVAAVRAAHLVPYLAVPPSDPHGSWPTLGQMIDSGHRLVMFTENAHDAAPWLPNFYTYGEETPFSFSSVEAMSGPASCAPNRGGTGRRLFLLNHFVTPASGTREQSAKANSAAFLEQRIADCKAVRHRLPTMIAVDFASLGQAQQVVDELNRAGP